MTQRTTFAKLQRERAKKQRAEEKRARRRGIDPVPITSDTPPVRGRGPFVPDVAGDGSQLSPDRLLRLVEQLTEAHDAGLLTDEELDEKRSILMSRV